MVFLTITTRPPVLGGDEARDSISASSSFLASWSSPSCVVLGAGLVGVGSGARPLYRLNNLRVYFGRGNVVQRLLKDNSRGSGLIHTMSDL